LGSTAEAKTSAIDRHSRSGIHGSSSLEHPSAVLGRSFGHDGFGGDFKGNGISMAGGLRALQAAPPGSNPPKLLEGTPIIPEAEIATLAPRLPQSEQKIGTQDVAIRKARTRPARACVSA
jgi:hypothetical protein